jgi:glycosyltransferase involved in cell wall biosynthesis
VTHFVAISERVREHFADLASCPSEKLSVIEYGYEVPAGASPTREALGWPAGGFLVGFLGRLVFEKNPLVLVDAIAASPDMSLVIVGDGPLRPDVERRIAGHGLTNVLLAGAIENASRLLPRCDVLCLPSHWEGLGLVLVEAMLQGVAVVGSNRGAVPDILGNGEYGLLFDPDRPDEISAALRRVREDPERARARARRALAYATRRFSIATMVTRTRRVYEDMSRGTRGRAGAGREVAWRATT